MRSASTTAGLLGAALLAFTLGSPSALAVQPLTALTPTVLTTASVFACPKDQCKSATECENVEKDKGCLLGYQEGHAFCNTVLCPDAVAKPKPRAPITPGGS